MSAVVLMWDFLLMAAGGTVLEGCGTLWRLSVGSGMGMEFLSPIPTVCSLLTNCRCHVTNAITLLMPLSPITMDCIHTNVSPNKLFLLQITSNLVFGPSNKKNNKQCSWNFLWATNKAPNKDTETDY